MEVRFYIVDAFVDPEKAFSGNPAAVILIDRDDDIADETKQKIAAQFNLSETVFVSKLPAASHRLIRWFTPTNEVPLCGHATMAAAHIIFSQCTTPTEKTLEFHTQFNQRLECTLEDDHLVLHFPLNEPRKLDANENPWLHELQRAVLHKSGAKLVDAQWSANTQKLLLRVENSVDANELALSRVKPDFNRLLKIDTGGMVRGVIVTQRADFARNRLHFCSRYFSPWNGINEDPVTGSSFTVLTPYWKAELNHSGALFAKQVSTRSGLVRSEIVNNSVWIGGQAKIFCSGTFQL